MRAFLAIVRKARKRGAMRTGLLMYKILLNDDNVFCMACDKALLVRPST